MLTPNDELAQILLPMGEPPDELPKRQNRTVVLKLITPHKTPATVPISTPNFTTSPLDSTASPDSSSKSLFRSKRKTPSIRSSLRRGTSDSLRRSATQHEHE